MYQVTAPLTVRQIALIGEFKRLESRFARTGVVSAAQGQRRAAIVAELARIEQQKLGVAA